MTDDKLSTTADRNSSLEIDRRTVLRAVGTGAVALGAMSLFDGASAQAQDMSRGAANFYKSDRATLEKVTFKTAYDTAVVGNLHIPNDLDRASRHPAIIVSHPMGAVKEQSANLYAAKMAEQGFVTIAIDLPFWGESAGEPRQAVSPDFYAEAYSAAADYLGTLNFVDRQRIGVIGICGSGSFALSAAKIDPRLKAIATVSMYDHGTLYRQGLGGTQTPEQFQAFLNEVAEQRVAESAGAQVRYTAGAPIELTGNAIGDEFYDFYRTSRGEVTPAGASPKTSTMPGMVTNVKFVNFYPLEDLSTVSPRPLMFITGDKAHSKEFSELAYSKANEPKELVWVKDAGHVDLYDRVDLIPFDKLRTFFAQHLA